MTANHRALEEIDIELIERIKLSPCLYDTRNPDFRLVFRKNYQWQRVGDSLGMSDSEARRRWTVLRDRYARELKQMHLNPQNSEFGRNEFFKRMDFLRKFVKKRRERKRLGELEASVVPLKFLKMECDLSYAYEMADIAADGQIKQMEESSQESNGKYPQKENTEQEDLGEPPEVVEEVHEYEEYGGREQIMQLTSLPTDSCNSLILVNHATSIHPSTPNLLQKASMEVKPNVRDFECSLSDNEKKRNRNFSPILGRKPAIASDSSSNSDELFSRVLTSYLRNLSRRYKIKAKVEMMQVVEKYIDVEETERPT